MTDGAWEATGGCYCGRLRFRASERPSAKAQCHCQPCQTYSGGGPNYFLVVPASGFAYVEGEPRSFRHPAVENAVTREFCAECGTQIATRRPDMPGAVILKGGALDRIGDYGGPKAAICTGEAAPFHAIPSGIPRFEGLPPGR